MGERTEISWTEATWNPWQGCRKVSAGCKFCYMYRDKERYGQNPAVVVRSKPPTFNLPLKIMDPARVFTCSWSDFFIEEADAWRDEAWDIISRTPHLTYQILTKRPERMTDRLPWISEPWPHVWLGVSVEDQDTADERIPVLLETPAAVRWISYEPALGPVSFFGPDSPTWNRDGGLGWVVVGGESGPDARPFDLAWARQTIKQCRAAGVPVHVKQLGADPFDSSYRWITRGGGHVIPVDTDWRIHERLRDRKGGDWVEWPEDLRIREYPQ